MKIIKRLLIGLLVVVVIIGVGLAGVAYYLHTPVPEERLARMKQSSLFKDGAFVNVEPQAATEITWDFIKEQFFGEQKREPDGVIPVIPVEPELFAQPASQELKATWFGHATVLVELEGKRVFIDPVFSERVSPVSYVGPKRMHPPPIDLSKVKTIDNVENNIEMKYTEIASPLIALGIIATSLFFVKSIYDKRRLNSLINS